jgi:hypothetical protein
MTYRSVAVAALLNLTATLTVMSACSDGVEPNPVVSPPPPPAVSSSQSSVAATPTSITAGSGSSTITVTARDASGNPVSGATVVLSATGTGNTLTQPAGPTNSTGVTTGSLNSTTTGMTTVSATAGGVAITSTATVTVTAPPPSGPILSGSVPLTGSAGVETRRNASPATASEIDAVYVSMYPGTVPAGASVAIRNRTTDFTIRVAMTSGGFDPVQIPAEENDALDIVTTDSSGHNVPTMVTVRRRQPPVVVRSEPPKKKTEVPLNAAIVVVFSVPMNSTSITPQTIQLLANGQPVNIGVALAGDGFRAVVTPTAPLAPGTIYHLVTTTGVRDVSDETPTAGTDVDFTTGTSPGYGFRITVSPAAATLPIGSALQLTATIRDVHGNAILGPTFRPLEWQAGGSAATITPTGLVRALQVGRSTISAYADSGVGTAVIDVVGAPEFPVGGSWDWTEIITDGAITCRDTGTYVFLQTGNVFTGTSQQAGACTGPSGTTDNTHGDPVTQGRAGGISLTFLVAGSCTYEARRTLAVDVLGGTLVCGTGTGTWEAHRPWPLSSLTLQAPPAAIVHGDTVRLRAALRDTAGHRVFARSVTWTTDNPAVATISGTADSALLRAEGPGSVTITASAEGTSDNLIVAVGAAGSIRVTTTTTGGDQDADGYNVRVYHNGTLSPPTAVGTNAVVVFSPLRAGTYSVELGGVADNCSMSSANDVTAIVTLAETTDVIFTVTCTPPGSLRVITTSAGADVPSGYSVYLDGGLPQAIGANGELIVANLGARSHTVRLGLPPHCASNGNNPRTIDVVGGTTTDVLFDVACVAIGRIVFFDGNDQLTSMAADGSGRTALPVFGYQAAWAPGGTRLAFMPIGGNCAGSTAQRAICLMNADGSGVTALPVSPLPLFGLSWSPDGSKIAFTNGADLFAARVDGSGDVPLVNAVGAAFPDWSPDGTRIAFSCTIEPRNVDICVINADGTGLVRITTDPADDHRPRWSPDGTKIVFVTTRFGLDAYENAVVAVMNADGSVVTVLANGEAPDWSPDGGRIAFLSQGCDDVSCWQTINIMRVDKTSSYQLDFSGSLSDTPAWKP